MFRMLRRLRMIHGPRVILVWRRCRATRTVRAIIPLRRWRWQLVMIWMHAWRRSRVLRMMGRFGMGRRSRTT